MLKMKIISKTIILIMFITILFTVCAKTNSNSMEIVEIKENMFIAQINYINQNYKSFLGKTIQYEGFVAYWELEDSEPFYMVIRNGEGGCCGDDAVIGFEIKTENNIYPDENDWVQVTGVLEEYSEDGEKYLRINVTKLSYPEERGEMFVTQ
jgi:uncharacterized membrane protein YcgQ (UPF0703/DUF1980 family)